MTLAASGEISIGGSTSTRSINLELGRSATATSSMGETALRNLANVASGAISMSNFHGKSSIITPWTGTVTVGLMSGQLYGVYRGSGTPGTLYAGNSTNTGGVQPYLKSFYYDISGGATTWLVFASTPSGDPSQITMTFDGNTYTMSRYAAGTYNRAGDSWGIVARDGGTYNGSITIP